MRPAPDSTCPQFHAARRLAAATVALVLTACGGYTGGTPAGPAATNASEAEWRALAQPSPVPLDGAARISLAEVDLIADDPWGLSSPVSVSLGLSELVAAGLVRRRDVQFVERRRFAAAAEAERRGTARRGAPPAGVSPGPELRLGVRWASFGLATAYLEMRLTDSESGSVVSTWRTETPSDPDPAGLARVIVGSLLGGLEDLGRLPAWTDLLADAAPRSFTSTAVPSTAVESFLSGLAAEERWDWEGARRGYQAALAVDGAFFEASAALARTARLRLGGTLGAS